MYYPQHLLDEDLNPFSVKEVFYYYSQEPNYEVNISKTFEQKIRASVAHVSQFEPSISKYTHIMPNETFELIKAEFYLLNKTETGAIVERFRKAK